MGSVVGSPCGRVETRIHSSSPHSCIRGRRGRGATLPKHIVWGRLTNGHDYVTRVMNGNNNYTLMIFLLPHFYTITIEANLLGRC